LFEKDLGERTLTHRLAVHLEKHFRGWDVDCDYNRLGERTLRLPKGSIVSTDDHLGKSIYPDIVVHQRDIPNNLLAIEVRKASNHQPPEHDSKNCERSPIRICGSPTGSGRFWSWEKRASFLRKFMSAARSTVLCRSGCPRGSRMWLGRGVKTTRVDRGGHKMRILKRSTLVAALVLAAGPLARQAHAQAPAAGPAIETAYQALLTHPNVVKALEDIKADDDTAFAEQKRITEIPAPPYKEKLRAEYFLKRFQELGFKDASIDAEGNVIALRKGSGGGRPKLVVSAHLDTVFAEGTDVAVKEKDGIILAPGIGDDSRGLAALLSLIKSINANGIATVGDVMFVGTVGEEELGNLRGVKALFRDHADIDGFISIDGLGVTRVVNQATGSHRYEMIFKGPGGHSFAEFGLPSAIHAMGRAIAKISDLQTPSDPKTTFTVGTVSGGTSVNAIAGEARMAVDMRSNSTEELLKLEANLLDLVKQAVVEENARWKSTSCRSRSS